MRGKKAKNQIRNYLHNLETETLAAIQLGGVGEWMFTSDVIRFLETSGAYNTCYEPTVNSISRIVQEFNFPKHTIRNGGRYLQVMI